MPGKVNVFSDALQYFELENLLGDVLYKNSLYFLKSYAGAYDLTSHLTFGIPRSYSGRKIFRCKTSFLPILNVQARRPCNIIRQINVYLQICSEKWPVISDMCRYVPNSHNNGPYLSASCIQSLKHCFN